MIERPIHGIVFDKQTLFTRAQRLTILSLEEGKLNGFCSSLKDKFILFEGGYYIFSAIFTRNFAVIRQWELLDLFMNEYQTKFIEFIKDIVTKYFQDKSAKEYFPFILYFLRNTKDKETLQTNLIHFFSLFARKEGLGSILSEKEEKSLFLYKNLDVKYKNAFIKKAKLIKSRAIEG